MLHLENRQRVVRRLELFLSYYFTTLEVVKYAVP